MTAPLTQEFDTVRKVLAPGSREDAALSVIERHVQDMETALEDIAVGRWNVRPTTRFGLGLRIGSNISAPDYARGVLDDLRAALPAREKGTERVCMICGDPANVSVCDRCCK